MRERKGSTGARNAVEAEAFLPLTPVVFDILLALSDADRHGYAILREIEERTGEAMRAGTLYRALARLLDEHLVEEVEDSTDVEGEDARRRYYRLTRLGRSVAMLEAARLETAVRMARGKKLLGRA